MVSDVTDADDVDVSSHPAHQRRINISRNEECQGGLHAMLLCKQASEKEWHVFLRYQDILHRVHMYAISKDSFIDAGFNELGIEQLQIEKTG